MEKISERSQGFVSTRHFSPGGVIFREKAFISIELKCADEEEEDFLQILSANIDKEIALLSESEKRQFYELEDNFATNKCQSKTAIGITMTNALRLPKKRLAIFLRTSSMLNHDCMANAAASFDESDAVLTIRAVKPISKGTEITMSVLNIWPVTNRTDMMGLFATSAERKQLLQTRHGFVCCCKSCLSGAGDDERSRIMLLEFYGDYANSDQSKEQLRLCEDIGMHPGILLLMSLKIIMGLYLDGDSTALKIMFDHVAKLWEDDVNKIVMTRSQPELTGPDFLTAMRSEEHLAAFMNRLRAFLMTFTWSPDSVKIDHPTRSVFANFQYFPGDIIFEESPMFCIDFEHVPSNENVSTEAIDPLIEKCIHNLSSSDKEELITLDRSPHQDSSFINIVKSNAYVMGKSLGVFSTLSKIRHSCMPNSKATAGVNGSVVVRAMETIKKGGDVTISYIESVASLTFSPTIDRMSVLKKHFHFDCKCKCCTFRQFDITRAECKFVRNAPSLKQNSEKYVLGKKLGMHPSVLCLLTFNYLVSLFTQTRERKGLISELCHELQEHASKTYGNNSKIVVEIEMMSEYIDFESIHKVSSMMKAVSLHPVVLYSADYEYDFEIVEMPGKGMGIVAKKDFCSGESIFVESPLFTLNVHPDFDDNNSIKRLMDPELNEILTELSGESRREFYQLADTVLHEEKRSPFGIVKTNAFNISPEKMAIFAMTSRFNHSCMANVHYYQLSRNVKHYERRMRLRATRPIVAGEEMYLSYVGGMPQKGFDTADARQRKMEEHFNFLCKCGACIDRLDDEKRTRIAQISTAEFVEEQYKLCKDIGLHAGLLLTVALECLVKLNAQEGSMNSIKDLSKEAKEYARIGFGTDLRIITKCLEAVEKAVTESELQQPIKTIQKILDWLIESDL